MTNFVPLKKQSKKVQREFHKQKRGSWCGVNPVSRIVLSKKAYNRKKQPKDFGCFRLCSPCI